MVRLKTLRVKVGVLSRFHVHSKQVEVRSMVPIDLDSLIYEGCFVEALK